MIMNKWLEFLKNNDFIGIKKYLKDNADVNDTNDSEESVLALAMRYRCDFDLVMLLVMQRQIFMTLMKRVLAFLRWLLLMIT